MTARSFMRVSVHVEASVRPSSGGEVGGIVRDVSLSGVSVQCERADVPIGPCVVHLLLRTGGDAIRVRASGEVVRAEDGVAAVRFTGVDPDDHEHLANLVLYNAPDATRFEQEAEERGDARPALLPVGDRCRP